MHLKNDDLLIRNATEEDAQILCDWWSNGKVMAHAGFPNGLHTDIDELRGVLKNEKDTARRLIIEIDSNSVGEMCYRTKDNVYENIGFIQLRIKMNSWKNQLGILQSSIDYELIKENFLL